MIPVSCIISEVAEQIVAVGSKLLAKERLVPQCTNTNVLRDSKSSTVVPLPIAIIMDFFASIQLHQAHAISGTAIPIFVFASCGSATLIRLFAPEVLGSLGDFGARTDGEARRTGESMADVGNRIFKHTDGTVVHVAGIPPMFNYEFFPQKLPWDVPMAPIVRAGHEMFTKSDGIFIGTCMAYNSEVLSALEGWLTGGLGKPLYAVGPLLPPTYASLRPLGDFRAPTAVRLEEQWPVRVITSDIECDCAFAASAEVLRTYICQ
ncbi:hypothetical protein FB451DRAFT_1394438 [Mycena latifolia]|nr:hypothetical protein FB451DRAFT_1394438 [Mycena latifolia]